MSAIKNKLECLRSKSAEISSTTQGGRSGAHYNAQEGIINKKENVNKQSIKTVIWSNQSEARCKK